MPLILVQNEVTVGNAYDFWKDIEGEQYHFPNKYIGRIKEGEPFIYYKGARRANNVRSIPEYFGTGIIGPVRVDPDSTSHPKRNWWWFCEIDDYVPFQRPVVFKKNDIAYENISQNQWGEVRTISEDIYSTILREAGVVSTPFLRQLLIGNFRYLTSSQISDTAKMENPGCFERLNSLPEDMYFLT